MFVFDYKIKYNLILNNIVELFASSLVFPHIKFSRIHELGVHIKNMEKVNVPYKTSFKP